VERYFAVERPELLRGETHDFVWVAHHGGSLSEKGIDFMMRSRTKGQYGVAFGAHRFRAGLTTTQALGGRETAGSCRGNHYHVGFYLHTKSRRRRTPLGGP